MQVLYVPQHNVSDSLSYTFDGDKITVTYNGEVDIFDFTDMPDGFANNWDRNPTIVSTLPISPVIEATKANGVLSVKLLNFIGDNATYEEKFPEWVTV
jgi:hypothetical protein